MPRVLSQAVDVRALQEAVDTLVRCNGNQCKAAVALGLPRETFRGRVAAATRQGILPTTGALLHNTKTPAEIEASDGLVGNLQRQLKKMELELKQAKSQALDHTIIRQKIIGLSEDVAATAPPAWMYKEEKKSGVAFGVPTVLLSDFHWGENVDPAQINGINEYSMKIAKKRLEKLASGTVRLLSILSPKLDYPGIVVSLGGDLVSGNLHEETTATNDANIMPVVLDLFQELCGFLKLMAEKFGKVFVPAVAGNHGRTTRKPWAKDRYATNYDWLIASFLAKHFADDPRFTFLIPAGPDARYQIYNHKILLTHGDQFKTGDSVVGMIGAVIRGDLKKRSRNSQIGLDYNLLTIGHFHTYHHLSKLVVNGSLVGMNEYGYLGNFSYEVPMQALYVVHPKHNVTFRMPVYVDEPPKDIMNREWVSVEK